LIVCSIAIAVAAQAVMFLASLPELGSLARLRREYPVVSVADRLSYENRGAQTQRVEKESDPPLAAVVEEGLKKREGEIEHWYSRNHALASLHDRTADGFVASRGFGVARMSGIPLHRIELPEAPSVPQVTPPEYSPDRRVEAPLPLAMDRRAADERPTDDTLRGMHFNGEGDFLNQDRMGYARDRDHVAGFQSHQFSRLPMANRDQPRAGWQVARLELISLLKHDTPVAYVSKNLPRMDELRDAPTRPLHPSEIKAVARLRSAEDVVIDEYPDHIRMVGSLRASKDCLHCHAVERGDLLGALTYELVPAEAVERPPANDAPPKPEVRRVRGPSLSPDPVRLHRFDHALAGGQ
jgi:hypothetical protein